MNHPVIVSANANQRLDQMIKEAEHHRLVKKIAGQQPARDWFGALRKRFPILKGQRLDKSASSPV